MPADIQQTGELSEASKELKALRELLAGKKEFLIIIHNNPDPDAIGSAAALAYLAEKLSTVKVSIAYGGYIGRAENRVMVNKLKIQLKQIRRIKYTRYDMLALVDTQPGAGNNSLPPGQKVQLVIDHHPRRPHLTADLVIIKPKIGVSATILIGWLKELQSPIPANLATALAYAISSETQNMNREASEEDIQAYLYVYVRSSIRKLAQIINPKLPRSYFLTLVKSLNNAYIYRQLICVHIGEVHTVEMVSEMADFFLRHEGISWCLCTGYFKDNLYLSLRTINRKFSAHRLLHKLIDNPDNVGGHELMAGGYIALSNMKKEAIAEIENKISFAFAQLMGYEHAEWKHLIDTAIAREKTVAG
jgi:nanoRNase/pAp phosphatase (c-di-AMP/oligoRNAs hydrolase)